MSVFLGAFLMIFLAEMGDKSQIMAFTLAGCYRVRTVLLGVFVATLVANGAAVFIGASLRGLLDIGFLSITSSAVFIGFGAWRLLGKNGPHPQKMEGKLKCDLTSFCSMVLLFILAETGDKTQIATAVYAANFDAPLLTLAGVTIGMMTADSLGIFLGSKLTEIISKKTMDLASSCIFFAIGIVTYMTSPVKFPSKISILVIIMLLILGYYFVVNNRISIDKIKKARHNKRKRKKD